MLLFKKNHNFFDSTTFSWKSTPNFTANNNKLPKDLYQFENMENILNNIKNTKIMVNTNASTILSYTVNYYNTIIFT